ncbi:MAG: hypothetical protein QMD04_10715 [Anaerolineales bacterium]|nr:hypothetical protein [Anaerolineales bacterium]
MTRTSSPDFEPGTLNPYVVQAREVTGGDRYGYKVVAVIDQAWDGWRAYRGPTSWSDQQVAEHGDPLSEEAAQALFPTLAAAGRVFAP